MSKLAVLLILAASAVLPERQYFRYERPVQMDAAQSGEACAALDASTFAHAAPELADLRLYRDGVATPYLIRQAMQSSAGAQEILPLNLGLHSGQTVFDAAMPDESYRDVTLDISGADFLATVRVEGSHGKSGARTLIGEYTVFDLSKQKLGRSTVLHIPVSNYSYLHFSIRGPIAPDQIKGISLTRATDEVELYETVAETGKIEREGRASVVHFTTPAHVPVDRVAFAAPVQPENFSRTVTVEAHSLGSKGDTPAAQHTVADGQVLRVHRLQNGHRIDEENTFVDIPEPTPTAATQWAVKIQNGDDSPVPFTAVKLEMRQRRLCFEAHPGARYELMYGDAALQAPEYDYATWARPQSAAATAMLAPEQKNPAYRPRPDSRPWTERHPALLWLALVIVVAVLGAAALSSMKSQGGANARR